MSASMEAFTAEVASRLTGTTRHQLRYWDRIGLVTPSMRSTGRRGLYGFRDLVALRVVKSLLDNGMSVQRIRRAWDYLRRTADLDRHLADVQLITDGQSVFRVAKDEGELLDALREGQLAFFVAINEITQAVENGVTRLELDRPRFLEMLRRVEDDVLTAAALTPPSPGLPPSDLAPTTYLVSDEALLARRPICAVCLYGCAELSSLPADVVEGVLTSAVGAREARWAIDELQSRELVDAELRVSGRGRAALQAFEARGFSPPPEGFFDQALNTSTPIRRQARRVEALAEALSA